MEKDKVLLITGCYRGIGKDIAIHFANLGVNIIMTYHNKKNETIKLKEDIINKYNVNVECFWLDLESEESIKHLYDEISKKYHKIDYLVNNASLSLDNYLYEKNSSEFIKILKVNVVGTFLIMKYFDKLVDGFIFNMSSTDGIDTGSIYSVDYNASKAGIISLSKTFSIESKNKIICLCPNWVDTDSTREIDKNYLNSELKRIKQDKLISSNTITRVISDCIKNNMPTGSIIRIDGDNDVRRID